jgi:hypothetical protein
VRRILFALCLVITAASSEACSRTPTSSRDERALASFQPYLTRELTPAIARERFGMPDEETGSGLRIYKYRVDGGRTLWLGFPGDAPITYARLESKDGAFTELTLR